MPSIVNGGTFIPLIPTAPAASESQSSFVITANTFFLALYLMVREVNGVLSGISITALPAPPSAGDTGFAASADTFVSDLPQLVTDVNAVISTFSLPCPAITTLPTTPSRGSNPTGFATEAIPFDIALTPLRTELNAFIAALNAYNPAVGGNSHRYLKFQFTSGNNAVEIFEIAAYSAVGGSNLLTGLTATGDVTSTGFEPSKTIDGNVTTYWSATTTPPTGGHWLKFDAGAGNTINPVLFHVLPRVFSTIQFPVTTVASVSDNDTSYTTIYTHTTDSTATRAYEFELGSDETGGYRYYWIENNGVAFGGASSAYLAEIRLIGASGQDLGLQSHTFIGNQSTDSHRIVFDDEYAAGDPDLIPNGNYYGVDLGRMRIKPASVKIVFPANGSLAAAGLKSWRLRASNTNTFSTSTILATVSDTGSAPSASEVRTYPV